MKKRRRRRQRRRAAIIGVLAGMGARAAPVAPLHLRHTTCNSGTQITKFILDLSYHFKLLLKEGVLHSTFADRQNGSLWNTARILIGFAHDMFQPEHYTQILACMHNMHPSTRTHTHTTPKTHNSQFRYTNHKIHLRSFLSFQTTALSSSVWSKGQLISKCPFGVIISTKIPTKKFDNFCPGGQIKKIKALISIMGYLI